jgi:hypothetical protein
VCSFSEAQTGLADDTTVPLSPEYEGEGAFASFTASLPPANVK